MKKILTASAYILLAACTVVSHQAMEENDQYVVDTPYAQPQPLTEDMATPEAYILVANRTVNKMLDETSEYYDKLPRPSIYVMSPEKQDELTPEGIYQARLETIKILEGSKTYTVVNNLNDAKYYLKISAKAIALKDTNVPAISYHLALYSSDNTLLKEWSQVIKQIQNDDKSWW